MPNLGKKCCTRNKREDMRFVSLFCHFFSLWMGSGWAHGAILGPSCGYLGAIWGPSTTKKRETEKRQKSHRNLVHNSVTFLSSFCRFFWLWLGSGWAHGAILGPSARQRPLKQGISREQKLVLEAILGGLNETGVLFFSQRMPK